MNDTHTLTDEQIVELWRGPGDPGTRPVLGRNKILAFARVIEAALRSAAPILDPPIGYLHPYGVTGLIQARQRGESKWATICHPTAEGFTTNPAIPVYLHAAACASAAASPQPNENESAVSPSALEDALDELLKAQKHVSTPLAIAAIRAHLGDTT